MQVDPIHVSIIVPVYNNVKELPECVSGLVASSGADTEIIVVDDGSRDGSPFVAAQMGIKVAQLPKNSGPATARNYGARLARGSILFFVDADVVLAPDAVARVRRAFKERTDIGAVFGSYDADPKAKGLVSRYRNLLHHFVHQKGKEAASTFWGGCGAVRRSVYEEVGGFDETFRPTCSIEDIELGYRIRRAGHGILLDKRLQGKHLKRWTLRSMISTDITHRAIPWSRLILETGIAPDDLNLKTGQRASFALVVLGCLFLVLALFRTEALALAAIALISVVVLNRDLYRFFSRQHGTLFAAACIPLHLLYYLYSGFTYLYVWLGFAVKRDVRVRQTRRVHPSH